MTDDDGPPKRPRITGKNDDGGRREMAGSLLLIRRSRVRNPAGSLSYEAPETGVREEVREGDFALPLGGPDVAAQVHGGHA